MTEDISDKTTKEEDRSGLTPETTSRTAKVGPRVSDAQKKLKFEDGKSAFVICILMGKMIKLSKVIGSQSSSFSPNRCGITAPRK